MPSSGVQTDRKSTRLNSSHGSISYAVFCLKKKTKASVPSRGDSLFPYHPHRPLQQRPTAHANPRGVPDRAPKRVAEFHHLSFFFFKDRATPGSNPLPLPAPLPF